MFPILLLIVFIVVAGKQLDPVADQIVIFKNKTKGPIGIMTTSNGAPVEARDAGSTLNANLLRNEFFIDSLTHLDRERIPVRPVHPKGAGAFGYFITTQDVSHICKADFLNKVGKKTPVAVRFSLGITERGGSDFAREPRGFAVKFYTEEGNFDIAGFNTPLFVVKDPSLFVPFVHIMRRNPATDLTDLNMGWDFLTQHPEGLFIFLIVYSDQGIPDGYRHMPGYSIHTYPLYNATGLVSYARFHFLPCGGIKTVNSSEAIRIGSTNPDYATADLYRAIAKGDYPSWDVFLQILTQKDVDTAKFDVFDITKLIPEDLYPLKLIGKMVLNRNAKNYFSEVEQMAFCPGNLVPGILSAPDKSFESRQFSYRDAQRYRLGANFDRIPVNCPYRSKLLTYNRDGVPPHNGNGYDIPNYYPNTFNGPVPYEDKYRPSIPIIHEEAADNFEQARDYYINQIKPDERIRLAENIVANLCLATDVLQDRAVDVFAKIHVDLSQRIAKGLEENNCKSNGKI